MGLIVVVLLLVSSPGIAGWYVFLQPKPRLITTLQDNEVGSLRWCIDNEGILTVINSTISNNSSIGGDQDGQGDGIFNEGKLTVIHSTFSNNLVSGGQGSSGGGIFNDGNLTATDSTFSNNKVLGSSNNGGGIEFSGIKGSSTILRFSTIYGNTSGHIGAYESSYSG